MIKRLPYLVLFIALLPFASFGNSKSVYKKDQLTGGFVIKRLLPDSSRSQNADQQQDTSGHKKVKEIAPAKRQPKPERIDGPIENNSPGVRPGNFPGVNRQPSSPGNQVPQQGGTVQPQQGNPVNRPAGNGRRNGGGPL